MFDLNYVQYKKKTLDYVWNFTRTQSKNVSIIQGIKFMKSFKTWYHTNSMCVYISVLFVCLHSDLVKSIIRPFNSVSFLCVYISISFLCVYISVLFVCLDSNLVKSIIRPSLSVLFVCLHFELSQIDHTTLPFCFVSVCLHFYLFVCLHSDWVKSIILPYLSVSFLCVYISVLFVCLYFELSQIDHSTLPFCFVSVCLHFRWANVCSVKVCWGGCSSW